MKKIITILVILLPMLCNAQYEYLKVNNVNFFWNNQPGSIDTLLFEVKPKGIYTEIGMYFDFTTRGTTYSSGDSLEVEMLFKLPPMAEVIDMWLWIGDTIIVADVYDKWTASQIYEDIVDRRTDPAILYKYEYSGWSWNYYQYIDYTDYYMFKIFPMLTNLPRKAKITYLVRNNEGLTKNPAVVLPINILKLSSQNILNTVVRFFPDSNLTSPRIAEVPASTFTYHSNPVHGNYYETSVANASSFNSLTLSYTQTVINSIAIKTHFDASHSENFYQLELKPIDLFGISGNKKALFLFDFIDANCNSLNGSQLLNQVKSKILSQFTTGDSVNFMFSGFMTHSFSNNWISADSASITNAFNSMNSAWFNTYSNLATLLYDGIQFIKMKNDIGSIVLIASSNTNGSNQQANGLVSNILNVMDSSDIPIHIIDLNEMNSPQYYIGGLYYYGNDYLYVNLSTQTTGEYYTIREDNFNNMLTNIAGKLSGFFTNFDMYTTLENGYTYSNFDLFAQSGMAYFDQPAQKIGKYNGSGRFRVIAHGQLPGGQLVVADTIIENNNITPVDSVVRAMWSAQLIRELASMSQTNSIVSQIVSTSMTERVLSDYTAFLALEPGIGTLDPEETGGPIVTIENSPQKSDNLSIFPNPFDVNCSISYSLNSPSHILIEVYDIFGKKLAVLADEFQDSGEFSLVYDASDLAAGIYICRMKINNSESITMKMVKK